MDFEQLKDLVKLFDASSIEKLDMKFKDVELNLLKNAGERAAPVFGFSSPKEHITILPVEEKKAVEGNVVSAPIVGTFYSSSAPDSPPFVNKGARVQKGDVLCIIEAMKVMNEITSAFDGSVADIFAANEELVEYGKPLFRIV